jgi:hypothetical protein
MRNWILPILAALMPALPASAETAPNSGTTLITGSDGGIGFALEAGAPRSVTTVLVSPGAVDTSMQRDIRATMVRLGKPITAPTSTPGQVAHAMVALVEQLNSEQNGKFLSLSGKEVPW